VVLTPFVLPGETVRVEVVSEKKNLVRAKASEIVEASPHRREPACPYFSQCGGCCYQHISYERQLLLKESILRETLLRAGKVAPPRIDVVAGERAGYRNREQFHIAGGRIGFLRAGSHELQPVMNCPIAAPAINDALAALRRMAHQPRFPAFLRTLELFTNGEQIQLNAAAAGGRRLARGFFDWCAKEMPGSDVSAIDYPAAAKVFRVGHRSFFQVNRFLVDRLVELALDGAGGETALDLYAGVGLFSLPLADRVPRVTAVETGRGAVDDLIFNAERAGLPVKAHRGAAGPFLSGFDEAPDFVLADPPRSGLGSGVTAHLIRLRPRRLNIVSCDPSTLARDLVELLGAGYRIEAMTLVDLFPETFHIETVTRLRFGD